MLSPFTVSMSVFVCVWGGGYRYSACRAGPFGTSDLIRITCVCIYKNIYNDMLTMLILFHVLFNECLINVIVLDSVVMLLGNLSI